MSETIHPVPADFEARIGPEELAALHERANADPDGFWLNQAQRLDWDRAPTISGDWSFNDDDFRIEWFADGQLNLSVNCLDRHLAQRGNRTALIFEADEPGTGRTVSYRELYEETCRFANLLKARGVRRGDRVMIYMPMIPEAAVAMLACARLGAPHSVVFGGFSADSLRNRIDDAAAKVMITSDGGYRRGAPSALKPAVDEALEGTGVEKVIVVRRTGQDVPWTDGRDVWWHDVVEKQPEQHTPEFFDAEHPLFILYTSGTTAKPKGILHTTGGYLTQVSYTHHAVFDLKPDSDVFWCTADIGWVTGHSYIVYGPLSNRATQVLYEGTPDTPHKGRFWELVQKYGVTVLYTAPTAIRTFMKWGDEIPTQFDMSSLRLLGSVGEPINPEAWMWYREHIGGNNCPIVDTWWQTETGAIMISPLPGVTRCKPGSAQRPLPGISADVVDDQGKPVPNGGGGYLVLTEPWPAMLRTIWGDDERYKETYWSRFSEQGYYFAGDGAKKDEDGDLWLLGRVDDVMNISGHRISTTEVESALVSHHQVAEAAVVGATDPTTGQGIVAFVILRATADDGPELAAELRQHVAKEIGPIAKPRQILLVPELPKTRSGKIMRRLLRDVAENRSMGDVTTLADPTVMNLIGQGMKSGTGNED